MILTYKSYTYKGGCVEHTLGALNRQSSRDFEVIVIENSGNCEDRDKLEKFVQDQQLSYPVTLLKTNNYPPPTARNFAAKQAAGEVIVSLEDDTILLTQSAFEDVIALSNLHSHGYGAKRLWTQPLGWFEESSKLLFQEIMKGDFSNLKSHLDNPDPAIRGFEGEFMMLHMSRSYIANFGFVKREVFEKLDGFLENFDEGIGHEDTAMMLMLYLKYGRPAIMSNINVAHVNHELKYDKLSGTYSQKNERELVKLFEALGVGYFNTAALLFPEFVDDHKILEFSRTTGKSSQRDQG